MSDRDIVKDSILNLIKFLGDDPEREGLVDTPERVLKSWQHLCKGYRESPESVLTVFSADGYDQIVLLKDIEMYSICEHHLLPFFGRAHVAYIPKDKIVGISKLARLVEIFSRRLQIQERICDQVTEALMSYLKPEGAACVIEAVHLCMRMRGVSKQNSVMVTSSVKGVFFSDPGAKLELMRLIGKDRL